MSPSTRVVLAVCISALVPARLLHETVCTQQEAPASRPAGDKATTRKTAEPFEQSVPGCTEKIRMIPIPAAADATEQVYLASTETVWDVYDVFVFAYDVRAGEKELDAISRPSKPYIPPDHGWGHAGYPAICITLKSAKTFCEWLSARTQKSFRLPTEAEWEMACRAGTKAKFSFGNESMDDYAWHVGNSDDKTHAVAQKKPNAWGFFDMHGNAAEWCLAPDGTAAVRGGAYSDIAPDLTCTARKVQTKAWNKTDPQIPKSPWWLSDGAFVSFRIACAVPIQ